MTSAQRVAASTAAWAALAIVVLCVACAYIWRTALFVNTYQLNVNIRSVTDPSAVNGEVRAARAFALKRLDASGIALQHKDSAIDVTAEADARGILSGRAIGVENLVYRSLDRNKLAQIPAVLGARYDLRTDGSGRLDYDTDTQILFVGPVLLFGPADAALFIEVALVVFAFGALEIRGAGMHPVVLFGEVALVGALAIALIALRQHNVHSLLPGYAAIFLLANLALVRWLWVTREKWSGSMRANYRSIVAVLAAIDLVTVLTFLAK